jgi:hypothetical protein
MSSRLPPSRKLQSGWKPEDVVTIEGYKYDGFLTGTYRGTVDAAGRPHGRGDFDVTEGVYAGYAYSGVWDGGERAAGEAVAVGFARHVVPPQKTGRATMARPLVSVTGRCCPAHDPPQASGCRASGRR